MVGRLAAFYLCQRISMLRTQRLHFSLHSCHLGDSWVSLHGFNRFQQMKKVRAIYISKNFDLAALVMVPVDCKAVVMYNLIRCCRATILSFEWKLCYFYLYRHVFIFPLQNVKKIKKRGWIYIKEINKNHIHCIC